MSGMKECSWMLQPQEKSQNCGINHLGWKRAPRSSSPAFKLRSSKVRASVVNEEKHLTNCKMIFPRHRGFLVTEPLAGEENEHVSLSEYRAFAASGRRAAERWSWHGVGKYVHVWCTSPSQGE